MSTTLKSDYIYIHTVIYFGVGGVGHPDVFPAQESHINKVYKIVIYIRLTVKAHYVRTRVVHPKVINDHICSNAHNVVVVLT